jgi:Zn-dependent peptidase ImmA (M78 family)
LDVESHSQVRSKEFLRESATTESQDNDFIKSFLPFVQKQLGISQLPKIRVVDRVPDAEGTTFGCYRRDENTIYLVTQGRHPKDSMRTLAHELVHYKQDIEDRLDDNSGATGSREENEANAQAGVIMRDYSQENPENPN